MTAGDRSAVQVFDDDGFLLQRGAGDGGGGINGGARVCRMLDRLFAMRPWPAMLILDNGPEFAGTALDAWAVQHGIHLHFIHSTGEAGAGSTALSRIPS